MKTVFYQVIVRMSDNTRYRVDTISNNFLTAIHMDSSSGFIHYGEWKSKYRLEDPLETLLREHLYPQTAFVGEEK